MIHSSWSTHRVQAPDKAQAWGGITDRFFGRLKVGCLDELPLDATLELYEVGPLRMFRIDAPAHHVERDGSCGELPCDDAFKLVLQVRGRSTLVHRHQSAVLLPGAWALYDPQSPYALVNSEHCTLLVTHVPRAALKGIPVPGLHMAKAGHDNTAGLHGVFGSYLLALSEHLPRLPDATAPVVSESVMGLLGSTLADANRRLGEPVPLPAVLKLRVQQYVQSRLGDPELSLQDIADAMRCSKRYLHRVFEAESVSLERYIWLRRLERCHAALSDAANAQRCSSEIAYAWGFKSNAHFSRLFKQHYGVTPTACQREAASRRHTVSA